MNDMSKHEREPTPLPAAWAVLLGMGAVQVTFNVDHAVHAQHPMWLGLALLYALTPVYAAMGTSHMIAAFKGGKALVVAAFAVTIAAMALSMGSVASVVGPTAGMWWAKWVFGLVLDGAALTALWVILMEHSRRAESAASAASRDAEERRERDAQRAAADAERAALALANDQEKLELRQSLADAEAALRDARSSARKQRRSSGRKPARTSAPVPAGSSGPGTVPVPGASSGLSEVPDLDAEARILALIDQGHSASQAGILAGKSDSYGRQVARLARAAQREPAGDNRSAGDME
jgi:hypothetical protein